MMMVDGNGQSGSMLANYLLITPSGLRCGEKTTGLQRILVDEPNIFYPE